MAQRKFVQGDMNFVGGVFFGIAVGAATWAVLTAYLASSGNTAVLENHQTLLVGLATIFVTLGVGWLSYNSSIAQIEVAVVQAQAAIFSERMSVF